METKYSLSVSGASTALGTTLMQPATPLWQRAPSRDPDGKPLSDFMMIIRGLRQQSAEIQQQKIHTLQRLLDVYHPHIVFADLNLKLNVLWITVKPIPGIILEIATAINFHIPEAKLVGDNPEQY